MASAGYPCIAATSADQRNCSVVKSTVKLPTRAAGNRPAGSLRVMRPPFADRPPVPS